MRDKSTSKDIKLVDLRYELQLLLGAKEIIEYINSWDSRAISDSQRFGNIVNYYKSCAYLHMRNLFNVLTREAATEIGTVPKIASALYCKWKPSIEKFGLHLNTSRNQKGVTNKHYVHLNEMIFLLTEDVIRCWNEWSKKLNDPNKTELVKILDDCRKSAQQDLETLRLLTGSSTV